MAAHTQSLNEKTISSLLNQVSLNQPQCEKPRHLVVTSDDDDVSDRFDLRLPNGELYMSISVPDLYADGEMIGGLLYFRRFIFVSGDRPSTEPRFVEVDLASKTYKLINEYPCCKSVAVDEEPTVAEQISLINKSVSLKTSDGKEEIYPLEKGFKGRSRTRDYMCYFFDDHLTLVNKHTLKKMEIDGKWQWRERGYRSQNVFYSDEMQKVLEVDAEMNIVVRSIPHFIRHLLLL